MNARRYYVLNEDGEAGPFDDDELRAAMEEGTIAPTDQVRSGMGTAMGSVEHVLDGVAPAQADAGVDSGGRSGARYASDRWSLVILVVVGIVVAFLVNAWTRPMEVIPVQAPAAPEPEAVAPPVDTTAPAEQKPTQPAASNAIPSGREGWLLWPSKDVAKEFLPTPLVGDDGKERPAYLLGRQGYLLWKLRATTPGTYRVTLRYGCVPSDAGSTVDVVIGSQSLSYVVKPSRRWEGGGEAELGTIRFD